ncbi:hypothetical protein E2542_SST24300 [Spatholobus suberectus]|nr:hypothetical protein E2542_SST24300 [Spatholobus suberectus]
MDNWRCDCINKEAIMFTRNIVSIIIYFARNQIHIQSSQNFYTLGSRVRVNEDNTRNCSTHSTVQCGSKLKGLQRLLHVLDNIRKFQVLLRIIDSRLYLTFLYNMGCHQSKRTTKAPLIHKKGGKLGKATYHLFACLQEHDTFWSINVLMVKLERISNYLSKYFSLHELMFIRPS